MAGGGTRRRFERLVPDATAQVRVGPGSPGPNMTEQGEEFEVEGTVRCELGDNGSWIECRDGNRWLLSSSCCWGEKSLFCAFQNRQIVACGKRMKLDPESPHRVIISRDMEHYFHVSTLRLVDVMPGAEHLRVGNACCLWGWFERVASDIPGAVLSFTIERGDTFLVANDLAGTTLGGLVAVWAYLPVEFPSSLPLPPIKYLWLVCPWSEAVTWDFRGRSAIGTLLHERR